MRPSRSPRRRDPLAPGQHRAAGRSRDDHPLGGVERRRGARGSARERGCRLRSRRARDDQHRNHPPGGGVSRPPERADQTLRDPPRDRRDSHDLRRSRWLHPRPRTRARPAHDRKADRRRGPGGGLRDERRGRRRIGKRMEGLGTTDVGGIGGTLSGNALSLAAMRATLERVLTDEAFERMIELGERFEAGVERRDRAPRPPLALGPPRLPDRIQVPARDAAKRR